MKKELLHIKKGFSLVELLVSVSIFLVFIIATTNVTGNVSKEVRNSANKQRAAVLAEEAIEASRNIRDENFNNLIDGTYGLSTSTNQWSFSGVSDLSDIFSRTLNITTINDNQKRVDVTINWADQISATNTLKLSTYLTNWRAILNTNAGLTVNKSVINHGASKVAADFAPYQVGTTTVNIGIANEFPPGVYSISESNDASYTTTFSGDCDTNGDINLVASTTNSCTITNEEKPSKIVVTKSVINHGLSKIASDFTLLIDSNPVISGALNTFNSGLHTVSEVNDSLYDRSFSGDCDSGGLVTLTAGNTKNCTITNEEKLSSIVLNKTVINHGGSKVAADFAPYKIDGNTVTLGATTTLDSGSHVVSEATSTLYSLSFSGDCNATSTVVLTSGATKYCTLINEEKPAYITVNKTVINHGGTKVASDFAPFRVGNANGTTTVTLAASTLMDSGTYSVSEANDANYTRTFTGDCNSSGAVTLIAGSSKSCLITNEQIVAPSCSVASALVGTPTLFDSSGATSAIVNKPTGVTTNDIMFAHILHSNSSDRLSTIPAGWTLIGRHKNNVNNQALYYKVAQAGEGSNYTFGLTSSSKLAVTISAYRGCFNTANPIATSTNVEYVANNTTYRAASINASFASSTVLMFPSMYTTTVRTFAAPLTQSGGWTEDYDHGNTSSDFSRAGYRKFISNTGVIGDIDSIGTSGTTVKHAFGVNLRPQ
jgi:prepilin-type N-terminal cleavage/methylation domain-containing protein